MEKLLIHDRNLRMRDRLLPLLTEGGSFIAVGAMHLIGEDGLVELLRAAGYTVTRIDEPDHRLLNGAGLRAFSSE